MVMKTFFNVTQPNDLDIKKMLQFQRILAAQSIVKGFDQTTSTARNPLFDEYMISNLRGHLPFAHVPFFKGTSGTFIPQKYNIFQATMILNNDHIFNLERERLLADCANKERSALKKNTELTIFNVERRKYLSKSSKITLDSSLTDRSIHEQNKFLPQQENRLLMEHSLKSPNQDDAKEQDSKVYFGEERDKISEIAIVVDDSILVPPSTKEEMHQIKSKLNTPKLLYPKKKQDAKWLASYNELKKYKEENGDCIVPRGYPLNPRLASWVAEQRKQYKLLQDGKNSSITFKRINLLNELDFAWNAQSAAWNKHINDLKKFKEECGDCLVPLNHPKFPKLGLWVKEQRRHFTLMKQGKSSHMTEDRASALNQVGFCWDTHEAVWGERLRELINYKKLYGDCIVPTNYAPNPKLGTWVHHQRRQYKKYKEGKSCHITTERIQALESIGFIWYPRERCRFLETQLYGSGTESNFNLTDRSLDLRPSKRQRI